MDIKSIIEQRMQQGEAAEDTGKPETESAPADDNPGRLLSQAEIDALIASLTAGT